MMFQLAYVPIAVGAYLYFGVNIAGVLLAILAGIIGIVLWIQKKEKSSFISPIIAFILGITAYSTSDFLVLKLYPLILSLLFLSYFISEHFFGRIPLWRHRLAWSRTHGSHPCNTGSNPVGAANLFL